MIVELLVALVQFVSLKEGPVNLDLIETVSLVGEIGSTLDRDDG
jgi:hypothetical protein